MVRWTLPAILVLAVLLRLPGHFYPVTFHYDEGVEVEHAVECLNGSLRAGTLAHPMLNRYLICLVEAGYYVGGLAGGTFGSRADFFQALETDRSGFLYVGRTVSLAAGLFTILLTYLLGRQVWSVPVGLAGALLLTVSPLHIMISNNLRPWSLGTCFATLALLFLTRFALFPSWRSMAVAGVGIGLAMASVYILGLLLVPFVVALGIHWRRATAGGSGSNWGGSNLAAASLGVAVGFAVGNFGALFAWKKVPGTLARYLARDSADSMIAYLTNAGWYTTSIWNVFAMGPLLASLAVVATLWVIWRASAPKWVLLSFVGAVFLIQPAVLFFWASRYAVLAYPVLLLAVSSLVMEGGAYVAVVRPRLRRIPVLVVLFLAVLNLVTVVEYHEAVRRVPTRELARQWVKTYVPTGTKLVLTSKYMSPVLPLSRKSLGTEGRTDECGRLALGKVEPCYEVVYLQSPRGIAGEKEAALREQLAQLAREGFGYVVYTDSVPPAERARLRQKNVTKTVLDAEYQLVSRFLYTDLTRLPDDTATVNPEVRVYRLRQG